MRTREKYSWVAIGIFSLLVIILLLAALDVASHGQMTREETIKRFNDQGPTVPPGYTHKDQRDDLEKLMASPYAEHTPCLDLVIPTPHFDLPYPPNWADVMNEDLRRIDKVVCTKTQLAFTTKPLHLRTMEDFCAYSNLDDNGLK